jgi:hypothetical protein
MWRDAPQEERQYFLDQDHAAREKYKRDLAEYKKIVAMNRQKREEIAMKAVDDGLIPEPALEDNSESITEEYQGQKPTASVAGLPTSPASIMGPSSLDASVRSAFLAAASAPMVAAPPLGLQPVGFQAALGPSLAAMVQAQDAQNARHLASTFLRAALLDEQARTQARLAMANPAFGRVALPTTNAAQLALAGIQQPSALGGLQVDAPVASASLLTNPALASLANVALGQGASLPPNLGSLGPF